MCAVANRKRLILGALVLVADKLAVVDVDAVVEVDVLGREGDGIRDLAVAVEIGREVGGSDVGQAAISAAHSGEAAVVMPTQLAVVVGQAAAEIELAGHVLVEHLGVVVVTRGEEGDLVLGGGHLDGLWVAHGDEASIDVLGIGQDGAGEAGEA